MEFCASAIVHRKYVADPEGDVGIANRLEGEAEADAAQQAIRAGFIFVEGGFALFQAGFTREFEHGGELRNAGQGKFAVRYGAGKIKSIFKRLHTAIITAAERGRITQNGLEREMIAQLEVVENGGIKFRISADGGAYGNAGIERCACCSVKKTAGRNVLIKRTAQVQADIADALGNAIFIPIVLIRDFQFKCHEADAFFNFRRYDIASLRIHLGVQRVYLQLALRFQARFVHQNGRGETILIVSAAMIEPVQKAKPGVLRCP